MLYIKHVIRALLLLALTSTSAQAEQLKSFQSTFLVNIIGFTVGEAKISLRCDTGNCTYINSAKPYSWAKRFINESIVETTSLTQTPNHFKMDSYKNSVKRVKNNHTSYTHTTVARKGAQFVRDTDSHAWPAQPNAYNLGTLMIALQSKIVNKRPITGLFIQDHKEQYPLRLVEKFKYDEIEVPFDNELSTERFTFTGKTGKATIWLMPDQNYFPARIEIFNKVKGITTTLDLNHLPKYR